MKSEQAQYEKIPVQTFASSREAARTLATEVAGLIRKRSEEKKPAVLGLATGSTPVPFYRELIRLHREEGLSFRRVITFNLDEYYGLKPNHPESYYRFMCDQLFDHVDIPKRNIHIPPGDIPRDSVFSACRDYEKSIEDAGGIDLQILGIGRTGHIGFNEPGSSMDSRTRMVSLDPVTRRDAARDFLGESNVPRFALTMGVGTILDAKEIVLMAWGENKSEIVAEAVEGPVTDAVSASFLQSHANARFVLDESASRALVRHRLPWMVGSVSWKRRMQRRAVSWLSGKAGKPVLKLLDEDYNEHGLGELVGDHGPAYPINIDVFNQLQHTITGWPGGKAHADDANRPERKSPASKRVLVLGPEPHEIIQGMGGTLERLVEQEHKVTVAVLTSGNLGVPDQRAKGFLGVLGEVADNRRGWTGAQKFAAKLLQQLQDKGDFGEDTDDLRQLKLQVRREETRDACLACDVPRKRVKFLDLPFYEKGRYRRFASTSDDVEVLRSFLAKNKPHQVFICGRVSDPSSVAGISFRVFVQAWGKLKKVAWKKQCRVWIYRADEKLFEAHEIDMAVPLSPDQLKGKIGAASCFRAQDLDEIADRNRSYAAAYDELGLANYEAIEAFERWNESEMRD